MIKETEKFDALFWSYNYPVQLYRDEDTKEISYTIYMPRKKACYSSMNNMEYVSPEELNDFIDNSIKKFKTAIDLFEKFKAGEIDRVYYWDEE